MTHSPALSAFQATCQEYYICFVFAADGMGELSSRIPFDKEKYPDQKLYVGHGHPDEGKAQAAMSASKLVAAAQKDGAFADILAKALLVRIYAEWDERFRHQVAVEIGVVPREVLSDLMGDLRRVRHWIVHGKSVMGPDWSKISVLPWKLSAGAKLQVTSEMLRQFADCVNQMSVRVDRPNNSPEPTREP